MYYKTRKLKIETPAERAFHRLPMSVQQKYIFRAQCMGIDRIALFEAEQKQQLDKIFLPALSSNQPLDNYTNAVQLAPEGGNLMAYERTRVLMGTDANCKPIYKQISGNTQDQRNDNIVKAYIDSGRIWNFIQNPTPAVPQASLQSIKESPTYKTVANEWVDFTKTHTEAGTKNSYKSYLKHSVEYFAETPVHEIRVCHIQEFLNSRVNKDEEFLAKNTIRNIWNMVEQVMDYAVSMGYCESNPARNNILRNPSDKESKRIALSNDELLEIRSAIPHLETQEEKLYMYLLTSMPYRRGEALGQRWEDIDFEKHIVKVTGTVTIVSGQATYRKKGKTESSLRDMIPPSFFLEAIVPYRKESGFVVNRNGEHLSACEINRIWESIVSQIPLLQEKGITPYNFRHTIATIMFHESGDVISVAAQCGHTDGGRTTQKVYIHDDLESRRKAVRQMEQSIWKPASG